MILNISFQFSSVAVLSFKIEFKRDVYTNNSKCYLKYLELMFVKCYK